MGMTVDQIRQVIKTKGELLESSGTLETYRWSGLSAKYYIPEAPESAGSIICDFDNGKLVGVRFGRGGSITEQR